MKRTAWTPEEDEIMRLHYPNDYAANVAKLLGRTERMVYSRANNLKLKKSDTFRATELKRQGDRLRIVGAKARYKPGSIPGNKGKKQSEYMSAAAIERSAATRFKKGNIPRSICEDGDGAVRPRVDKRGISIMMIRLSKGKWKELARYNWEYVHKKAVPKNHVLRHIDGNTWNCNVDNLELISCAENMVRNSAHDTLPDKRVASYMAKNGRSVDLELKSQLLQNPQLLELKRQQIFLNRKIKQNGKQD